MSARIAVVIVGHNSDQWLHDCLAFVTREAPRSALFIYVDNASSDSSCEVVKRFPGVLNIFEYNNRGFGAACNKGAALAMSLGADVLFFLNPDTRAGWYAVSACADLLRANRQLAVVGPLQEEMRGEETDRPCFNEWSRRAVVTNGSDVLVSRQMPPMANDEFLSWLQDAPNFVPTRYVNGAGFCVRGDTFLQLGGFDERFFLFFEEVALCRDAWRNGYHVGLLTRASIEHAWGGHSNGARRRIWVRSKYLYLLSDRVSVSRRLLTWSHEWWCDVRRGRLGVADAWRGCGVLIAWFLRLRGKSRNGLKLPVWK